MRLSDEQRAIRAGEEGEPRRFALEQQMAVGRFFGAEDFAPIAQVHLMADCEAVATGDLLEVDPEAGTVHILERAAA
jgi:hypothetical protein